MKNLLTAMLCVIWSLGSSAQISPEVQKLHTMVISIKPKTLLIKGYQANPSNLDNLFELGAIYSRTGKLDSAKIMFNKLIETNQKAGQVLLLKVILR